jgi:predicted nucleotidyltransferase component of viral defense system
LNDSPAPQELERIAGALGTDEALVEKDWHVVRALKVITDITPDGSFVFTGGTCLSKAWGLIERFSEDVDFKVNLPDSRPQRREHRKAIETALTRTGFTLTEPPIVRDEGRFFAFCLDYSPAFPVTTGLRPHLQIEVTARPSQLPPIKRPIQSFVAQARGMAPEVAAISCADPVETAAEKLSALAWRILSRGDKEHDPSVIRHLHDLAALEARALATSGFSALVRAVVEVDNQRGNQERPKTTEALFQAMLDELTAQPHWKVDYETFIRQVSYATADRAISFEMAMAACGRIVTATI